ncbi:hypothetical protein IT571_09140 [Candidatus Sumerlaeota bacterium]|nr:hypothetical protein [Candidatus Sumerlaeota bacterium]
MKIVVIILAILTLTIWMFAGIRLFTATPDTKPLISLDSLTMSKSPQSDNSTPGAKIGETGKGGALVNHLRGNRLEEMENTASISTANPHGNVEASGATEMERAEEITDRRESDLKEAKKKIAILDPVVK